MTGIVRLLEQQSRVVLLFYQLKREDVHGIPGHSAVPAAAVVVDSHCTEGRTPGVITHVAKILSGGTGLNFGISIDELKDYFDFLKADYGVEWEFDLFREAYDWVKERVSQPAYLTEEYGAAITRGVSQVYEPFNGDSSELKDGSWRGFTIFDNDGPSNDRVRKAADSFCLDDKPETLTILVNHLVEKIAFTETEPLTATPASSALVEAVGATLLKEIPEVGQNYHDRLFTPVGCFFKKEMAGEPVRSLPAEVPPTTTVGTVFRDFTDKVKDCRLSTLEEISGANSPYGATLGTLFIIPPSFRSNKVLLLVRDIFLSCVEDSPPGFVALLCNLPLVRGYVEDAVDCLKRVAAPFTFSSSCGPGAKSRLRMILDQGGFDGILEEYGKDSCTGTILSVFKFLLEEPDIIDAARENNPTISVQQMDEEVAAIQGYISAEDARFIAGVNATLAAKEEAQTRRMRTNSTDNSTGPQQRELLPLPDPLPIVPRGDCAEGIRKYVESHGTSIWHHVGSTSIGTVVDAAFKLIGIEQLYIVDAGCIPQVGRMNPASTVMAMGRFAGLMAKLADGAAGNDTTIIAQARDDPIVTDETECEKPPCSMGVPETQQEDSLRTEQPT
ncbi:unnamed protein product [Vitrella brassicaformis CCMP3155]|uniref:Glucose-methanol-choline oxidoreductase C-terminal domain-containing protein n=1 Tax=Vitrella brassicaformis (strain CCMP3155) TaxID=1169540 RepID=A0A0G4GJZ4_VITBC|nr:unnamed protein product [Vitrella brassicaformis CCMP3155]|eukprot:CEM30248.1 unnamed protein product [Vitrella brassicaformis CCMP3155]